MTDTDLKTYNHIRSGGTGVIEMPRGLFAVSGKEAVQFLDGMVTNDMKTLVDGAQMLAAFPNAQGRLLAVVRVLRQGDRFLFETEEATREKVFNNLFRFTYAGDFFVEDLSDQFRYFQFIENLDSAIPTIQWTETSFYCFNDSRYEAYFIPVDWAESFRRKALVSEDIEISVDLYETLRIENGIPLYGVD